MDKTEWKLLDVKMTFKTQGKGSWINSSTRVFILSFVIYQSQKRKKPEKLEPAILSSSCPKLYAYCFIIIIFRGWWWWWWWYCWSGWRLRWGWFDKWRRWWWWWWWHPWWRWGWWWRWSGEWWRPWWWWRRCPWWRWWTLNCFSFLLFTIFNKT